VTTELCFTDYIWC